MNAALFSYLRASAVEKCLSLSVGRMGREKPQITQMDANGAGVLNEAGSYICECLRSSAAKTSYLSGVVDGTGETADYADGRRWNGAFGQIPQCFFPSSSHECSALGPMRFALFDNFLTRYFWAFSGVSATLAPVWKAYRKCRMLPWKWFPMPYA